MLLLFLTSGVRQTKSFMAPVSVVWWGGTKILTDFKEIRFKYWLNHKKKDMEDLYVCCITRRFMETKALYKQQLRPVWGFQWLTSLFPNRSQQQIHRPVQNIHKHRTPEVPVNAGNVIIPLTPRIKNYQASYHI